MVVGIRKGGGCLQDLGEEEEEDWRVFGRDGLMGKVKSCWMEYLFFLKVFNHSV